MGRSVSNFGAIAHNGWGQSRESSAPKSTIRHSHVRNDWAAIHSPVFGGPCVVLIGLSLRGWHSRVMAAMYDASAVRSSRSKDS